jgi:spore coat protein U-like protein
MANIHVTFSEIASNSHAKGGLALSQTVGDLYIMRKFAIILAGAAAVAASPALAAGATVQTTNNTVDVTLNVNTACSVTTKSMSFGTLTSVTGGATASSATTVKCTPGAAYTVYVDNGKNSGGTTQRKLASVSSTDTVNYNVYQSDGTTVFPTAGVTGTGNGNDQAMTLVGKLTATSEVKAAAYSDVLTVTLDY